MKVLREVGQFRLCEDDSAGYKVYYVENTILTKYTKGKGGSYNFDEEIKILLLRMSDSSFGAACKYRAGNDIDCKEVAVSLWDELGDTPVDDDGCLDEDFTTHTGEVFEKGTDREEIWQWFESCFKLSVAEDLMFIK